MERLKAFIREQSITGTAQERRGGLFLEKILKENEYFKAHPRHLVRLSLKEDPYERFSLGALYEGKSKEAVLLFGHYDVVDVENYGDKKEMAFCDADLKKAFLKDSKTPKEVRLDIESQNFLFGRGSADMKMGLYVHLKVLEALIKENYPYSIVYLAVADEETDSGGMRSAISWLHHLKKEGFCFRGAILSEPCLQEEGEFVPKIHLGSCGKCTPIVLAEGKSAHVFESEKGHNANTMLSCVQLQLDGTGDFEERVGESKTPKVTQLQWGQLGKGASVTVPQRAYATYSLIFLQKKPEAIMAMLLEKIKAGAADYGRKKSCEPPFVYAFSQIEAMVSDEEREKIKAQIKSQNKDIRAQSLDYMEAILERAGLKRPFYAYGLMPPFYPSVYPTVKEEKTIENLRKAIESKFQMDLKPSHYFMGISDMSFMGMQAEESRVFLSHLIGERSFFDFDEGKASTLQMPAFVLGTLGKDVHQATERAEIDYNLNQLPHIYRFAIDFLLDEKA